MSPAAVDGSRPTLSFAFKMRKGPGKSAERGRETSSGIPSDILGHVRIPARN